MQRAVAFAGYSSSGKTTLICRLIEHFAGLGVEIGAIKHTHHSLADLQSGGDTERFLRAGARTAILATSGEAVLFSASGSAELERFVWKQPSELMSRIESPIVFIEGFKSSGVWPRLIVGQPHSPVPAVDPTVIASVGVSLEGLPGFPSDDIEGLAGFLDRILRR